MRWDFKKTAFRSIRDVGLFLTSARSDAQLEALRREFAGGPEAFDRLYENAPQHDPWASGSPRYHYQRRKYDALLGLLPARSYRRALDLGCGLGLFTERLSAYAEEVVGIDISAVAIRHGAERTRALKNVEMRQGDVMALGADLDARFDLIVIADTLYYLPAPIQDELLKTVAARVSRLLTPDGIVMLVNHYFPLPNSETRLTLRIHRAFQWSPAFVLLSEHRRAFFLATLLGNADPGRDMSGTSRVPIQSLGSANSRATEPGRTA
jgi:SAM-dependent methyltransferase